MIASETMAERRREEQEQDVDVEVAASHPRAITEPEMAETLRASPGRGGGQLEAGTLLEGTYRVLELLGQGAMGAVYLVEHVALGKHFAAKVVADSARMDAAAVARLRNEARMAPPPTGTSSS